MTSPQTGQSRAHRVRPQPLPPASQSRLGTALRRGKWPVLVGWLLIAIVVSGFANRLTSVEKTDEMSFLPRSSQSTEVSALLQKAQGGDALDAVFVYHREHGLTDADKARLEHDRQLIASLHLPGAQNPGAVRVAHDGATAVYAVPVDRAVGTDDIKDTVKAMRKHVADGNGLQVRITGAAGLQLDHAEVFSGVGTTLLYVTLAVVTALLLLTYRSPVLWVLPLFAVGLGLRVAQAAVYVYGKHGGTVSDLSAGILTVLAFGAGTDYALLLISRYREELRRHADRHEALAEALRRSVGAITASAGTVVASMLCLLAAELNSDRGLGPVAAMGVAVVYLVTMTLLPALLVIFGRWLFWPVVPRTTSAQTDGDGMWSRIGSLVARRPRAVWAGSAAVLLAMGAALFGASTQLNPLNEFPKSMDSVSGQRLIAKSFPAGASDPTSVVVPPAQAARARAVVEATPGVEGVLGTRNVGDRLLLTTVLHDDPYSAKALTTVRSLRSRLSDQIGGDALVGGPTATQVDTRDAAARDDAVIGPLVLGVILLILVLLLRAVLMPVLLILTVVLSFAAAFGASTAVFDHVLGFAGINPSIPLYVFIFLVALGVDYNIFLMHRVREESATHGTRAGTLRALAGTGGVITSAAVVLAGTFAALAVLPFVPLAEVGFAVAFGVLLDAVLVRSFLVPALVLDIGPAVWWPRRSAQRAGSPSGDLASPRG